MVKRKSKPPQKRKSSNSPPDQKSTQKIVAAAHVEHHAGPIPSPKILQAYENISPGLADRIMSMAETETGHRQKMENRVIEADIEAMRKEFAERRIGQLFGLIIGLAALGAGTFTAVYGHPVAGGFMGTGGVVALVTAFIYGRLSESQQGNNTGT
jgi:uncharacterized membrane protein